MFFDRHLKIRLHITERYKNSLNSLHIGEGYVEININEDVILISWLEDSAGSKPNPCTVRTHQEKRENSATEEI